MFELMTICTDICHLAVRVRRSFDAGVQIEAGPPALKPCVATSTRRMRIAIRSPSIPPIVSLLDQLGAAAEFVDFIFSRACGCREGEQQNVPGRLGYPLTDPSLFDILETGFLPGA